MSDQSLIYTHGKGFELLEKYFRLFSSEVPHKVPRDVNDWQDATVYEAPHGFLVVWEGGRWRAECGKNCVEFCKERREPDDEPDISMTCSFPELAGAFKNSLPGVKVDLKLR